MRINNKKDVSEYLNIPKNEINFFYKYNNNIWHYQDKNKYCHLFKLINNQWIELTKNIKTIGCWYFENEYWGYQDENKILYKFNKNNELISKY